MSNPPLWESLLFSLLLLASGAGFWYRFRTVAASIAGSKPDPGFRWGSLDRRIATFFSEVLCQSVVIRERFWPGLAHAFVFWGFCAFAFVTLDHFAAGFGFRIIPRDGLFGKAYFGFVALFAIAVALSIAGLAIRRFIVQPKWLGKVAYESLFIASLILTLMLTYLATFAIDEESLAGHLNWWLHTAALLIFLPLVPHTKHLHLVLSPFSVFAKRPGFSDIPPLAGDEDFGIDTGKDITNLVALQAYSCVECGRCTEHCPAYNTGKALNPKEIILGVRGYLNEYGSGGSLGLLEKYVSEEAIFQCTTCGACEDQCPVGIQHLPIIIGLRRGAANTGKWEDDYGTKLFLNLERNGNPMGFSTSERTKFIEKNELPVYDGTQEFCLWMGCMGSYDPQGRDILLSLVRVLRHFGVTFGVLKKERCTGDSARRLGNDLLFSQLAEANIATLSAFGKKPKLLSICPHCVRTISEDWKEYGASFRVTHHSELLAELAPQMPKSDGKVVFHDPCYLGRYRGVYEEPRAVAGIAGTVIDPPRARNRSRCCGAGGGLAFLGEEKGTRVNMDRAAELAATGAETVAAACPFCATMFRDALAATPGTPPQLLDIAQIAARSLES